MKKRFTYPVAALAAVCLIAAAVAFVPGPHTAAAAESRYIDLYLIAGQSNAAGYSSVSGVTRQTFSNVMYAGEVNRPVGASGGSNSYLADFADSVTTGLGRSGNYIGPEYGMAEVLDPLYTGDHKALIFKSAAGGTSLQNTNSGESATYGNWLPPSERNNYPENAATGVQYDLFLDNFRTVFAALTADGYAPRVKGMVWMQGEADRTEPDVYETLIPLLIADMRSDLSDITGADLSQMPFVMGEISDTYKNYADVGVNRAFNAMLRGVPASCPYTAVIDSGRFAVNDASGAVGTDQYHWSGADMEAIGRLFAEAILSLTDSGVRVDIEAAPSGTIPFTNGSVAYSYTDGTLTLTAVPDEGCTLTALTVGGLSVPVDGSGVYSLPVDSSPIGVKAVFSALSVYTITYRFDETKGIIAPEHRPTECTAGQSAVIGIQPRAGYETAFVTCNGVEMVADPRTGLYATPPVTEDITISVTFRAAENSGETDASAPDSGCGCGGALAGTLALSAAALAVFVKKPF